MTRRLLSRALQLAERGWHVFPLRARDKRPLRGFTNWEVRATTDRGQIIQCWTAAPYNIGIATGPSGLLVIDCDTSQRADPPGWRLVGDVVELAGIRLPRTFMVQTPSGGVHLYFAAVDRFLKNSVGKLARLVDTRGVGGYIVGPGSVLRAGYYRVASAVPVAEVPQWVVDGLAPLSIIASQQRGQQHGDQYVQATLGEEAQRVRSAVPGTRNNALNIGAFLLGQLVGAGRITSDDAWDVLRTAAGSHLGIEGFTQSEMNQTIRSGLTAGLKSPRSS